MKKQGMTILLFAVSLYFLIGCTQKLDQKKQHFNADGITYELQLPGGWKVTQEKKTEYGLQTAFSAEDSKSNSSLVVSVNPVKGVAQKDFGEQTRIKLKERYRYKQAKDIYMKKLEVGNYPAYKYTLNTKVKDKSVWAHFYYIWTKHGFVQLTFYSADDNSYEKRSEKIDESVATFKEIDFDESEAKKVQAEQKKEEGDVITIENSDIKIETTGVRQITGKEDKKMLAIRYTFTNLSMKTTQPSIWKDLVVAKQNGQVLSLGALSENTSFLDVEELAETQSQKVKKAESVESVVLYELLDTSKVELSFSQEAFPGKEAVKVVVPA
ncbi:hypothetical protein IGJ02_000496 [Enterococcus sp. DIV0724b]|uniref:DUF5067 domain-containing protein n=1 Tax=Enterococcus sp. DIV0724b TaxID=2774694 RepID=UPI003D2FBBB1